MSPSSTNTLFNTGPASRGTLLRFLLSFAWKYRWGCVRVLCLQLCLLAMGLLGLSLMGTGVDYIRFAAAGQAGGPRAEDKGQRAEGREGLEGREAVALSGGPFGPSSCLLYTSDAADE